MARKEIRRQINQASAAHKRVMDFLTAELSLPPNCSAILLRLEANRAIEVEATYWPPELEPPADEPPA